MKTLKSKIIAAVLVMVIAITAYTLGAEAIFSPQNTTATPILYNQDTVTTIYENASPAVVEIDTVQSTRGFYGAAGGQGSGFLIDTSGNIVTNNHVVSGAESVKVILKDGRTIDAKVVGTDAIDDLAVVNVDASAIQGITPLALADSSLVKPGQLAIAIGNPYGLDGTVTVGVISGLNRTVNGNPNGMLQTDAAINPGNSGGPLLDANGTVIGVNTAIESPSTGAKGIGFAVPSNTIKQALPDLTAGKQITHPWIGITGVNLTQDLAQKLGVSFNQGAYVVSVVDNSPASKAGLKGGNLNADGTPAAGGDVITTADGNAINSMQDLQNYINSKKVGDTISLSVLRSGSTITVSITLESRPDNANIVPSVPRSTPIPMPFPGMPRWRNYQSSPND